MNEKKTKNKEQKKQQKQNKLRYFKLIPMFSIRN